LSFEREAALNVRPWDEEYETARARARWAQGKIIERLNELDEIDRLVEEHAPELLGQVPERPLEGPFDHAAALRVGQQVKTLLGMLLARRGTPNGAAPDHVRGAPVATAAEAVPAVAAELAMQIEGPFAAGRFRVGAVDGGGFGKKQWGLLDCLWDREAGRPRPPVPATDVAREVYGTRGRIDRHLGNLASLRRDLNARLHREGYAATIDSAGRDEKHTYQLRLTTGG
jgi:hypothetical protein